MVADLPGRRNRNANRIGWGRKNSGLKAVELAEKLRVGFTLIEDGFLRSLTLPRDGYLPQSMVYDCSGIYYDATQPSDLERLIIESSYDTQQLHRASDCITSIRSSQLSKYNHTNIQELSSEQSRPAVLVVDQAYNDEAVRYGLANSTTFQRMLDAAIDENPGHDILVKLHPDYLRGTRSSYLAGLVDKRRCVLVSHDVNPWTLLDRVVGVYVVSSLLGFEALMAGKRVSCFGVPFYSGWGLTHDMQSCNRRGKPRSLEHVFYSAYIKYTRYINPYLGVRCEIEDTIRLLSDQKTKASMHRGGWRVLGVPFFRRKTVRGAFGPFSQVVFANRANCSEDSPLTDVIYSQLSTNADCRYVPSYRHASTRHIPFRFIDVWRPAGDKALVSCAIFPDTTNVKSANFLSLEDTLNSASFAPELLKRASHLITAIRAGDSNLTLSHLPVLRRLPVDRNIVLVISDGTPRAWTFRSRDSISAEDSRLLTGVRTKRPDAYLVWIPFGARKRQLCKYLQPRSAHICDLVLDRTALVPLLSRAVEVHTTSSLGGFTAVLRENSVFTYGSPFYAGWGLTTDDASLPSRKRKLTIEELVAGSLVLYPTYIHSVTHQICDIETALALVRLS